MKINDIDRIKEDNEFYEKIDEMIDKFENNLKKTENG